MFIVTLKSKDKNYFECTSNEPLVKDAIDEALYCIKENQWEYFEYTVDNVREVADVQEGIEND